jgi:N-hydroxyarylamine O-acetyltransferase
VSAGDEIERFTIDVERYLARIGYTGSRALSAGTLAALQRTHMMAVPFENLHVVAGISVSTDVSWSYPKIVEQRRGGWCFELNGAFGALLEAMGFEVTYHSARVWDPSAHALGPATDHLCLLVAADGERWLVDVGFGDSTLTPLRLATVDVQRVAPRPSRLDVEADVGDGDGHGEVRYAELLPEGGWELQYSVDLQPRTLDEFEARSDALAAGAGGGHFTSKPFATRALDHVGGRVWLLRDRLKLRDGASSAVEEQAVAGSEWDVELQRWFSMTIPGHNRRAPDEPAG